MVWNWAKYISYFRILCLYLLTVFLWVHQGAHFHPNNHTDTRQRWKRSRRTADVQPNGSSVSGFCKQRSYKGSSRDSHNWCVPTRVARYRFAALAHDHSLGICLQYTVNPLHVEYFCGNLKKIHLYFPLFPDTSIAQVFLPFQAILPQGSRRGVNST